MYNKQQYKNVRHQATRRAQKWLKKLRHLDAIQVLFVSVANESPVAHQQRKTRWFGLRFCLFWGFEGAPPGHRWVIWCG